MKKIFALALAALMTAGMTTVAFAAKDDVEVAIVKKNGTVVIDKNDDNLFDTTADDERDIADGNVIDFVAADGGHKVAFPLYNKDTGARITEKDDVKGLKVKAEWRVGDVDAKPEIEYVKVKGAKTGYMYAVTFTLPENADIKMSDLAGEISVYRSSSDIKDDSAKRTYNTVKIGVEYGYGVQKYIENSDLEDAEVVDFKGCDGVETLTFGDILEFEVDVTGQGKLNLKWNEDFNKEFAGMYDYANIDFVTFEKAPSFNKNGQVWIYADEDAFIYEVTEDGAKEIKGLKWDEDYEAWTFKTRTLKSYAISDVELTEKTATEDKDDASSTTDGGKKNPDTGR